MVDIQTISVTIAAATITITAILWLLQLRESRRHLKNLEAATNIQAVIKLYEIWTDQDLDKDRELMKKCNFNSYEEWRKKYSEAEEGKAMQRVGRLYEMSALLARRGMMDTGLLIEILGSALIDDWKFMRPLIYGLREEFRDTSIGENMEWVATSAMKSKDLQETLGKKD